MRTLVIFWIVAFSSLTIHVSHNFNLFSLNLFFLLSETYHLWLWLVWPFVSLYSQIFILIRDPFVLKSQNPLFIFYAVLIPPAKRKELVPFMRRVASLVPSLQVVDVDIPLGDLCKDDQKLEQIVLGREFHISLGRTVPIRVHQIDSVVTMLRQKLQSHKRSVFSSKYFKSLYCLTVLKKGNKRVFIYLHKIQDHCLNPDIGCLLLNTHPATFFLL